MVTQKNKILAGIGTAWKALLDTLARVPVERVDHAGVVERWSVKDLIGHVTTWENEAIEALGNYKSQGDVGALAWPDVDALNERTVQAKRSVPLAELRLDFEETHRRLLDSVEALSAEEFTVSEVEKRVRIDTFAHYEEHTDHIDRWLGSTG